MSPDDRSDATTLAKRIEQDGEWHVSASFQSVIRDQNRNIVAIADGDLFAGRDFECDARDSVDTRRLFPALVEEIARLERLLEDMRSALHSSEDTCTFITRVTPE